MSLPILPTGNSVTGNSVMINSGFSARLLLLVTALLHGSLELRVETPCRVDPG